MNARVALPLLMTLALGASCRESDPVSEDVKIGLLVNLEERALSESQTAKVLLALRDINAGGGLELDGIRHDLSLAVEDHAGTPPGAVAALHRFAEQGVTAVVGPPWSSLTLGTEVDFSDGAVAAAIELQILLVSGSATASAISELDDDDLMWRTVPSDTFQARLGAEHIFAEVGLSTAAIIYRDDAWGRGMSAAFVEAYERFGGTVTASVGYPVADVASLQARNYSGELDELFGALPAVIYLLNFREVFAITNQIVSGGYLDAYASDGPFFFGSDGTFSEDILNNVPAEILRRLEGTTPYADPESEAYQRFAHQMIEAGLGPPENLDANRFDAVYLIALAMQKAQSTSSSTVKAELQEISRDDPGDLTVSAGDWAKAREHLLSGGGVNYEGASGPIEFDDVGDPTAGIYVIWRVVEENGQEFSFDLSRRVAFSMDAN